MLAGVAASDQAGDHCLQNRVTCKSLPAPGRHAPSAREAQRRGELLPGAGFPHPLHSARPWCRCLFPIPIMLLVPIRQYLMPRIFRPEHLLARSCAPPPHLLPCPWLQLWCRLAACFHLLHLVALVSPAKRSAAQRSAAMLVVGLAHPRPPQPASHAHAHICAYSMQAPTPNTHSALDPPCRSWTHWKQRRPPLYRTRRRCRCAALGCHLAAWQRKWGLLACNAGWGGGFAELLCPITCAAVGSSRGGRVVSMGELHVIHFGEG